MKEEREEGGWRKRGKGGKGKRKGRTGRTYHDAQTDTRAETEEGPPKTRTKSKQKGKGKKKVQYVKVGDNLSPALNAVVVAVVVVLKLRVTKSPVEGPIGAG